MMSGLHISSSSMSHRRADGCRRPCIFCHLAAETGKLSIRPVRHQLSSTAQARIQDAEELPAPDMGWLWDTKAAATRAKLAAIAAKPKKSLGQNFVTDDNILARIVRDSGILPGDYVLEVGPGTGNLTKHLVEAGATVLAVEKDYALAEKLTDVFKDVPHFRCIQGDVLRVNLPDMIQQLREMPATTLPHSSLLGPSGDCSTGPSSSLDSDGAQVEDRLNGATVSTSHADAAPVATRVKVVANLPYYITSDILKILFPMGDDISVVAFMLQDEVAQRLVAPKPDGTQYRAITVVAHYYSTPRYKLKIDRRHYFPSPQVHGALVTFDLKPSGTRPLLLQERSFLTFVRQAFSSKRKKLSNSLQPMWQRDDVISALHSIGADGQLRPQDLSTSQYVDLYKALSSQQAAGLPKDDMVVEDAETYPLGSPDDFLV